MSEEERVVPQPPEEDRAAAEAELNRRADDLTRRVDEANRRADDAHAVRAHQAEAAERMHRHVDELARRLVPAGTRLIMPVHIERGGERVQVGVAGLDVEYGSLLLVADPAWSLLHVGPVSGMSINGEDA